MTRIASIGECMIELSEHSDGRITRAFGGDTLNTAVYLARLGLAVDYVTGLGDDGWSEEMLAAWRAEGVGTDAVLRFAGRLPGLYIIQTDARGERRFSHWRDSAPARDIFRCADTPRLVDRLGTYSHLYFSGISLSLYGASGRATLLEAAAKQRAAGGRVVFDTNFRARGWPDRDEARSAYRAALSAADLVFASVEDLNPLFGDGLTDLLGQVGVGREIVLKLDAPSCRVMVDGKSSTVDGPPVARVVDTTAAGDSFAAAYLAARLDGASPEAAARAGHRLAGTVVQHRGAIIPRDAMPDMTEQTT